MLTIRLIKENWNKWQSLCPPARKVYLRGFIKKKRRKKVWISFLFNPLSLSILFLYGISTIDREWYIKIGLVLVFAYLVGKMIQESLQMLQNFLNIPFYQKAGFNVPENLERIHAYWECHEDMREWDIMKGIFTQENPYLYRQIKHLIPIINTRISHIQNQDEFL